MILREFENGHTKSDVVMIVAGEGIVFMGDLLFENRHPYLAQGKPEALIGIMDHLIANKNLKVFVPGHGEPGGKDVLLDQSAYVKDIRNLVERSVSDGQPDSVTRKIVVPTTYSDWKFGRFFPANVNFLMKEIKASKISK